ncbi:MAG: GTP 3',8-cyclase MoaA [Candidatus Brockarchaeota archaeon]|nr:GTP 3',8-cyclase MoaA [Candidatus Brockarchaeota archaeon]
MLNSPGKRVKNLRICVTESCNLKCFFCHKEWDPSSNRCISLNEIKRIVEVACSFGVEKIKITGGEPLMRNDIVEIVKEVSPLVREVSLVTNGVLLEKHASRLKEAGLSRVNVNLPTLNPLKYREITGSREMDKVFNGINAAIDADLNPIKINMVILKRVNEEDVAEMLDYTGSIGAVLQLIELQPIPGDKQVFEKFHLNLEGIEKSIALKSTMKTLNPTGQRAIYTLSKNGAKGLVEIVSPFENPEFCSRCSKLRVTCDGRLKSCLLRNDNLVDIVGLIRSGADMDSLRKSFMEAIMLKEPYWKKL